MINYLLWRWADSRCGNGEDVENKQIPNGRWSFAKLRSSANRGWLPCGVRMATMPLMEASYHL
jgi:hypothetical protein